jgi:hypothetical protein
MRPDRRAKLIANYSKNKLLFFAAVLFLFYLASAVLTTVGMTVIFYFLYKVVATIFNIGYQPPIVAIALLGFIAVVTNRNVV